jgi:hypothetical protein
VVSVENEIREAGFGVSMFFIISTLLDEFIGGCFFKNNFREKNVFFFFVLSSSSCSLNFISIFHES